MLRWGLLFVCFVAAVKADENEFTLGDKWAKVISGPEGTKLWDRNTRWTLTADQGSTIKVYCEDFRFPTDEDSDGCNYSRLTFDDGASKQTICGFQHNAQIFSKTSKLVIDLSLEFRVSGYLYCWAKAVHPPKSYENVDVTLGGGIKRIEFPQVTGGDNDKTWRFKSTTKDKISLQCKTRLESVMGDQDQIECIKDMLTVDAGNGPKVTCGYQKVVYISKETEITLRLETFPGTVSSIECVAQAITGPNANEYENADANADIDSSEHGVSPGSKRTTCQCGLANRDSGGRIINGTEVKLESKFPFMVSMRYPGGDHFCGASIITPRHILTAAHCVSDRWTKSKPVPSELEPTVGVHARSEDASHGETQRLKVKEVFVPQEWFAVNGSLKGDIALLELESPIKMSKWVSPVCLTPNEPPIVNKLIKAMGWGYSENGYPDKLREAYVFVLDKAMCNNDPKEVCFKSGKTSSCFGDSGGPYVYVDPETNRYTQVALVSYGFGNCEGGYFVGTNTVHWYKWIQDKISASGDKICRKEE